jgi:hypothetical protein
VLVGKTHMATDLEVLKMLGIAPDSIIGVHVRECGFEPYERDDGLHPTGRPRPRYDAFLREHDLASDPQEFLDRGADPSCADVIARLQQKLFDRALHPNGHITTPSERITAYADNQLQVKGGTNGIWDEAELTAIHEAMERRAKG